MDPRASFSILLLLVGAVQASPLMVRPYLVSLCTSMIGFPQISHFKHFYSHRKEQRVEDVILTEPEVMDITTKILESNNGQSAKANNNFDRIEAHFYNVF